MTIPELEPSPPPPSRPFQFRLRTLLLLFVVLGSSLAVFGAWGIAAFAFTAGLAICLNRFPYFPSDWLIFLFGAIALFLIYPLLTLLFLLPPMGAIYDGLRTHLNWPNIAALAVWLLSVGTLLIGAVRGRKRAASLNSTVDR